MKQWRSHHQPRYNCSGIQDPRGCGFPTFAGASYDIYEVGMQTVRLAVDTLIYKNADYDQIVIETKESMMDGYVSNKLTIPLLDKDNCLPLIPTPTDIDYHVKKPTEPFFMSCCNEFWWCLQNVAKGIWRVELPYAKLIFENTTRASLDEMVDAKEIYL